MGKVVGSISACWSGHGRPEIHDQGSQFVLAVPILSENAVPFLIPHHRKRLNMPYRLKTLVGTAAVSWQPWHGYCEENFRNTRNNRGGSLR